MPLWPALASENNSMILWDFADDILRRMIRGGMKHNYTTWLLRTRLVCFSVALRKHREQSQLTEGRVYSGLEFQKDKRPRWRRGGTAHCVPGIWRQGQEAEKSHGLLQAWSRESFLDTLKACSQWHTLSSKAAPPRPPQTVLPARDQMFKCVPCRAGHVPSPSSQWRIKF